MKNRYRKIMEMCKERTVSVEEMAEVFGVSASTIRRDLVTMEDQGMITRVYGGAKINNEQIIEPNMNWKEMSMVNEKQNIARYAASLVSDGDIVFVDAGTTTSKIINYITARDVLIVTHGLNCVEYAKERNMNCYVPGGYLKRRTNVLVSNETIDRLNELTFNVAFVAANGCHPMSGFTCSDELESNLKATVIRKSLKHYICLDSSKFNKITMSRFASLVGAEVVTDRLVDNFDYSIFSRTASVTDEGIRIY